MCPSTHRTAPVASHRIDSSWDTHTARRSSARGSLRCAERHHDSTPARQGNRRIARSALSGLDQARCTSYTPPRPARPASRFQRRPYSVHIPYSMPRSCPDAQLSLVGTLLAGSSPKGFASMHQVTHTLTRPSAPVSLGLRTRPCHADRQQATGSERAVRVRRHMHDCHDRSDQIYSQQRSSFSLLPVVLHPFDLSPTSLL